MAKWGNIESRGDVEDRRSFGPVAGGLSITGIAALFLINYLMGGDPVDVLNQLDNIPVQQQTETGEFEGEDEYEVFTERVLGSNDQMWSDIFVDMNQVYNKPTLVLFRQATNSACGGATSAVGPHYCPLDNTIYLDETFFDELENRFGAEGGDVAEAYVIAHEVGHHAQNQLGLLEDLRRIQQSDPDRANEVSIQIELQADCFAGLWANSIRDMNVLEPGEIQEAMDAAAAVGDDNIQQKTTGRVNPENWNHGSSEQRVEWFMRGYEQGNLSACSIED